MAQFKTQNFTFFAPRTVIFYKKIAVKFGIWEVVVYLCDIKMILI